MLVESAGLTGEVDCGGNGGAGVATGLFGLSGLGLSWDEFPCAEISEAIKQNVIEIRMDLNID